MTLRFRRAELKDLDGIVKLMDELSPGNKESAEKMLKRRFGHLDSIAKMIDQYPVTLVGTNQQDSDIYGFMALSNGPTPYMSIDTKLTEFPSQWDKWIKTNYESKHIELYNTKFLSMMLVNHDVASSFMNEALITLFKWIPDLKFIAYLLDDSLLLYPPLSLPRPDAGLDVSSPDQSSPSLDVSDSNRKSKKNTKKGSKYFNPIVSNNSSFPFSLQICARKDIVPILKIRKSRVEDCDDLSPMLKKQNIIKGKEAEYFLAELLESNSDSNRTLVAEADGTVIGFMSFSKNVNMVKLAETFELDSFNNLLKPGETLETSKNVFCMNLFCIDDQYANQAFELVRAAYQTIPDCEYCILTTAPTVQEHPFWKHFTLIKTRNQKLSSHLLYLSNRYGESVKVRIATSKEDLSHVHEFINGSDETIINDVSNPNHIVYLVDQGKQTVGFAILDKLNNPRDIIDQFDVEEYISVKPLEIQNTHSVLKRFDLNPLFQHQSRWVLEEIFRLQKLNLLLYRHSVDLKYDFATKSIVLREFSSVKPRRQIQYPNNLRDNSKAPEPIPYNVQILTAPLLYQPKISVNTRIVIIGGSNVAISFLENLIYKSHLHFTNITLISDEAFPSIDDPHATVNGFCYSSKNLIQLGLENYITLVHSSVTKINREKKRVQLLDSTFLSYDYLFLTCGVQFHASQLSETFGSLKGIYNLNRKNTEEINKASKEFIGDTSGSKCIVYGKNIQVYCTLQRLMNLGVPSSRIIVINPQSNADQSCFDNQVIDEKVHQILALHNIQVYRGYRLVKWGEEKINGSQYLASIALKNQEEQKTAKIANIKLFLYGDEKSVNPESFKSINDCYLVFDGRLVIDKYFRTQDPFIFGAGSFTKYSSKFQTRWTQAFNDAKEVGKKLSETVLPLFDPAAPSKELNLTNTLLEFTESKKVEAYLPENYYYFHYDKPRLPNQTKAIRQAQTSYGRELVIDTPEKGYLRIHVDTDGYITSMTYLGRNGIPSENYASLYGVHEKYVNRLLARFDEGILSDLTSFLNETWALPLYHDRFKAYSRKLTQELMGTYERDLTDLVAYLKEQVRISKPLGDNDKIVLYQSFDTSSNREHFDKNVFNYMIDCGIFDSFP